MKLDAQELQAITAPAAITAVAELIDLFENHCSQRRVWAYRGQSRPFGSLQPSFQRQFTRPSSATAELIERHLVQAFREHYAKLPDRHGDMPTIQQIDEFRTLRCLSVMQHYEIPTRLLDWSASYWTSLYFACASDPGEDAELWFYDRDIFMEQRNQNTRWNALLDASPNPAAEPAYLYQPDMPPLVELDPKISPRMRTQQGHHTVASEVFSDHASLIRALDLERQKLQTDFRIPTQPQFGRVIITSACKSRALQFLAEHHKITASSIFPDVVGLGRFLRWQFDSLRTMLL